MNLKKIFTGKKNNDEKQKILISLIGGFGFLTVSVFGLNILHNPIVEQKISGNQIQEEENFHQSAKKVFEEGKIFKGKKIFLTKNFYLINAVEKISEIYQENGKISFKNFQEKEIFLRKIAKKYTLKNISEFRKNSTAEKNVEKFSWRLLNKTLPVGFEIDMEELEDIFVKNLKR